MASPSNTASTSPVLILGHSFVRRLREFVRCRAHGHTFYVDFNLTQQCDVSILGIGGRTVDKIMRHDLHQIRRMAPEIVILELGSNDLCDESCDAESVSLAIEALVELLHKDMNVRFTMVCEVIPREKPPYTSYNEKVYQLNSYLHKALNNASFAKTWRHRGLSNPAVNIYMPDGIHLNEAGNKALYRSYRGAILFALSQH